MILGLCKEMVGCMERFFRSTKSTISWDVKPCSPVEIHQRFGGTYYLHIKGWKSNQAKQPVRNMAYTSILKMVALRYVWTYMRWASARLHGDTSQNMVLFMVTDMRDL